MRYRHVWPGFLLLGSLVASLIALLGWGDGVPLARPHWRAEPALRVRSAPRGAGRGARAHGPPAHASEPPRAAGAARQPGGRPTQGLETPTSLPQGAPDRRSPVMITSPLCARLRHVSASRRGRARRGPAQPGRVLHRALQRAGSRAPVQCVTSLPRDPDEARARLDRLRDAGFVAARATARDPSRSASSRHAPEDRGAHRGRLRNAGHDPARGCGGSAHRADRAAPRPLHLSGGGRDGEGRPRPPRGPAEVVEIPGACAPPTPEIGGLASKNRRNHAAARVPLGSIFPQYLS